MISETNILHSRPHTVIVAGCRGHRSAGFDDIVDFLLEGVNRVLDFVVVNAVIVLILLEDVAEPSVKNISDNAMNSGMELPGDGLGVPFRLLSNRIQLLVNDVPELGARVFDVRLAL